MAARLLSFVDRIMKAALAARALWIQFAVNNNGMVARLKRVCKPGWPWITVSNR
jgi:hypothetical protein